ncbi:unnamed protein product, partial [Closterium sp. NIES-54]
MPGWLFFPSTLLLWSSLWPAPLPHHLLFSSIPAPAAQAQLLSAAQHHEIVLKRWLIYHLCFVILFPCIQSCLFLLLPSQCLQLRLQSPYLPFYLLWRPPWPSCALVAVLPLVPPLPTHLAAGCIRAVPSAVSWLPTGVAIPAISHQMPWLLASVAGACLSSSFLSALFSSSRL